MEKTREKSFLNIKSKLMAAVAMLLVAFFMVISSSYAWFTLSTAPEVTGIYTAVGANGNLEIALYTGTDVNASAVGDTGKYTTWGNLIDLSAETYGLDDISLLPSAFGVQQGADNALNVAGSPLLTPSYGSDGRISTLTKNSIFGEYAGSSFKKITATNNYSSNGVKAIGTASSMTQQEIDYTNAIIKINAALASAQNYAVNSLKNSGSDLANIAAQKALEKKTDGYDVSFVADTDGMLDTLDKAAAQLLIAMDNYYAAKLAADNAGKKVSEYNDAKAADVSATLTKAAAETEGTVIRSFYDKYNAIVTASEEAREYIKDSVPEPTSVSWNDVEKIFIESKLVIINNIKLNDYTMEEAPDHLDAFIGGNITAQLPEGSGAYADIAELCGNYNVGITVNITAGGLNMSGIAARMATTVADAPTIKLAESVTEPSWGAVADGDMSITAFYGYAIDLAFRTNVEGSSLMLQTDPVNRIYTDGKGSSETMGKGSTMTFKSAATSFSEDQIEELMKGLRVVFTDGTGVVIGVGVLDADNAILGADGVTANLYLCEYEIANIATGAENGATEGTLKVNTQAIKLADEKGRTELVELEKNTQTIVTAYVYLDGTVVDNTMVANAAQSMTGSLNLQFSSDATLVPMPYAPLQDQTGSDTPAGGEGN